MPIYEASNVAGDCQAMSKYKYIYTCTHVQEYKSRERGGQGEEKPAQPMGGLSLGCGTIYLRVEWRDEIRVDVARYSAGLANRPDRHWGNFQTPS